MQENNFDKEAIQLAAAKVYAGRIASALAKGFQSQRPPDGNSLRHGQGRVKRPYFGRHESLRAVAETHEEAFSRPQLRNPVTAQGFHMDKNILRTLALGQKAKSTLAVEPFDDGDLEPARRRHCDTGAPRSPCGLMP